MTPKLSTDELFHFTKFDRLTNIIKEGFYPRYNLEHTFLSDLFNRPAAIECIPMVCFCDIPLSMVQYHSSKYGKCAIGLDKKWGERYGLNPVIYVHKNSRIGDAISALANSFSNYKPSMILEGSDMRIFLMISAFAKGLGQLSYYVKQYERTEDEHYLIGSKNYSFIKGRFYDEREWRFVPSVNSSEDFWLINAETMTNDVALNKANKRLKKYSLNFGINDIKNIVCETIKEKEKLVEAISEKFDIDKKDVFTKIKFNLIDSKKNSS